eukprot:768203-Hanusia_phi.AAC.3
MRSRTRRRERRAAEVLTGERHSVLQREGPESRGRVRDARGDGEPVQDLDERQTGVRIQGWKFGLRRAERSGDWETGGDGAEAGGKGAAGEAAVWKPEARGAAGVGGRGCATQSEHKRRGGRDSTRKVAGTRVEGPSNLRYRVAQRQQEDLAVSLRRYDCLREAGNVQADVKRGETRAPPLKNTNKTSRQGLTSNPFLRPHLPPPLPLPSSSPPPLPSSSPPPLPSSSPLPLPSSSPLPLPPFSASLPLVLSVTLSSVSKPAVSTLTWEVEEAPAVLPAKSEPSEDTTSHLITATLLTNARNHARLTSEARAEGERECLL